MKETTPNILIVEDDTSLAESLTAGLTEAGYTVLRTGSCGEAQAHLEQTPPDVVLLDLGLPDSDGMDLLNRLRTSHPQLPVIITTARDELSDRVAGLEGGADDYLVKPYAFKELLARIRIQLRHQERIQRVRKVGNLVIDLDARTAICDVHELDLTPREFDLLLYLASLQGEVAFREMLQRSVWKVQSRMTSINNVIDVHISRLRQKLDTAGSTALLQTVWGVGFVLKEAK